LQSYHTPSLFCHVSKNWQFSFIIDLEGLKNAILNEKRDQAWWNNGEMINYEKATKALTGSVFTVLGLSILNYGTKLETVISNNNE